MDYTIHGILQATFPFSRGSSQPRDWIPVSNIAGRFFFFSYYYYFFYFTILYWFAIHQHASATGVHVFPILNPPPSPYYPSGSSHCTSPKLPVSCMEPGLVIHFLYDIIHVLMLFSQIIPPPPTDFKRLFYNLCLFCCPAYRVVITISLNSIYMC